jgi:hypothetical protein
VFDPEPYQAFESGPEIFTGTNAGNRALKVSTPRNKKIAKTGETNHQSKRDKERLIRLDDLIPKQDVKGGGQLLFGVAYATNTTNNPTKES